MATHAAGDANRPQDFESFRRHISGKIVGPMPAKYSLKTYLTSDSNPVSVPDASYLRKVNEAKTEAERYIPFIDGFKNYVTPGPRFVNSHESTLANWDKSSISSDRLLIDNSVDTTWIPDGKSPTKFLNPFIENIGMILELKTKCAATDPFADDPKADSFEIGAKEGKSAKESSPRGQLLGQICDLKNTFRKFQHYRLVLQEFAKSLEKFKDVKELLNVFSDVIRAHDDAYEKAHILHRDVSAGNIMIDQNGRGLLIDWDLSKSINTQDDGAHQPERTGTWQFISYNLGGKQEPEHPIPIHSKDDDLESFFHVLYWIALRCCDHGKTIDELRVILEHNYDLAIPMGDKPVVPEGRMVLLQNPQTIPNARFKSPAIDAFLEQFHNIVGQRYILQEKHRNLLISWKEEILKANPEGLDNDEIISELERRIKANKKTPMKFPLGIEPVFFLESLRPDWAPKLYEELFGPNGERADWATGCTNIPRPELSTTARRSLMKRKSDISDCSHTDVGDSDKHLSKKPRMDSTALLPSVHEDEE